MIFGMNLDERIDPTIRFVDNNADILHNIEARVLKWHVDDDRKIPVLDEANSRQPGCGVAVDCGFPGDWNGGLAFYAKLRS